MSLAITEVRKTKTSRKHKYDPRAIEEGYRSGLEHNNAEYLEDHGYPAQYEESTIYYMPEIVPKRYKPDFILMKLDGTKMIIETKGRFVTADRKKHKLLLKQYPNLDIRLVFSNSKTKISKKSKTTYGMWCDGLGIHYSDRLIPLDWLRECDPNAEPFVEEYMYKDEVAEKCKAILTK